MGTANRTPEISVEWPARFGSWAERFPETATLCRSRREVAWRLRPPTAADAAEVVREAVRTRTPLWPVSLGRNWGYGSHLPARDGAVILDLGALAAISDLDRASQSVRIEPGVTQGALHAFLGREAPDLAFNVTGSAADTSVLGNALDRGTGYFGEKDRDLYALEVLLADGTVCRPAEGRLHRSRPHPAGLSTDALFFQSNLAVVLGGRLRLRLRQEAEDVVVLQGDYAGVIGALKRAYDARLLGGTTHVAEPGRSGRLGRGLLRRLWGREPSRAEVERCFPETGRFSALAPLQGRRRVVDAAWRELKGLAGPGVRLTRANRGSLSLASRWLRRLGLRARADRLDALRPLLALCWGEPSDVGLGMLDGYASGSPDRASRGAISGNAVASLSAADGARMAALVRARWPESAFTWIVLDPCCMIVHYMLHFDDAAADEAHRAGEAIVAELRSAGFPSYRLGINTPAAPGAEGLVERVKEAFDPLGLIAPGRYEP